DGRLLSEPWIQNGQLVSREPTLREIRARAERSIAALPPSLRTLVAREPYPVEPSEALVRLRDKTIDSLDLSHE
nr:nicotinate phosphoribosyltransferase [Nocardioidaceae bacterium]